MDNNQLLYNFDANTSIAMEEMNEFDTFDNYINGECDISSESADSQHNFSKEESEDDLFMALDFVDFSTDETMYKPIDVNTTPPLLEQGYNNCSVDLNTPSLEPERCIPADDDVDKDILGVLIENDIKESACNIPTNVMSALGNSSSASYAIPPPSSNAMHDANIAASLTPHHINSSNANTNTSTTPTIKNSKRSTKAAQSTPNGIIKAPKRSSGKGRPAFPVHLHELLSEAESLNFSSKVSWLPHGRAFVIHDTVEFAAEVLPKYFSHNKMAAFQRQLNAYGFRRCVDGPDKGAFFQELFVRGRPEVCALLSRQKKSALDSTTAREPDFYRLPFVGVDGKELTNASVFKTVCPTLPTIPKLSFQESNKAVAPPPPPPTKPAPQDFTSSHWQQILKSYCPSKPFPEKGLPNPTIQNKKPNFLPLPCHVQDINSKIDAHSILPRSAHQLDSVTFFIPLDLLL